MNKDIKDYLHLYLGCQLLKGEGTYFTLTPNRLAAYLHKDIPCEDVKPILRPLSDMTDEEEKELGIIKIDARSFSIETHFESFRTLLSKYFDLFRLIEAGLAIDKTKLDQ